MKRSLTHREDHQFYLFLLPAVAIFTLFVVVPLVMCMGQSFTNYTIGKPLQFVGFKNYLSAFRDPIFQDGFSYTILYTVVTTILLTLLGIVIAIVFSQKCYFSSLQRIVLYFPSCISLMVAGFVWRYLLSSDVDGLVNMLLGLLGLPSVNWLSGATEAKIATLIVGIWVDLGWCGVLFLSYIQAIPQDLYMVAHLEGATQFQQARYITIPLITPAITINLTVMLAQGLKVYELPQALTKGGPMTVTNTITHALLTRGVTEWQFGLASAFGIIIFLMTAVLSFLQIKLTERFEVQQ